MTVNNSSSWGEGKSWYGFLVGWLEDAFCELLPQVSTFKAIYLPRDGEGIAVQFLMLWHQGGVSVVIKVAMVIMTFW